MCYSLCYNAPTMLPAGSMEAEGICIYSMEHAVAQSVQVLH